MASRFHILSIFADRLQISVSKFQIAVNQLQISDIDLQIFVIKCLFTNTLYLQISSNRWQISVKEFQMSAIIWRYLQIWIKCENGFLYFSFKSLFNLFVMMKVKFSHTRYRLLGQELIPVYRQSARSHPPAVGCHYFQPGLSFTFVSVRQMAPPLTDVTEI